MYLNKPVIQVNHNIKAKELRVLDENGENLGVLSKEDAIRTALDKGLDLIEVGPTAKPPVARIMNFDKFRYDEEKKRKKQQVKQKTNDVKQIQISVRAAKNDLEIKAKRMNEFLKEGHPINLVMVLRGREKRNKDWAKQKLEDFLTLITVDFKQLTTPRWGGRGMNVQIVKK